MAFSRTSASDALEQLAWHFSFFPRRKLSINEVAEATGMAWATVRKFSGSLEELTYLMPAVTLDSDGVTVVNTSERLSSIVSEPMSGAALYLFVHGRMNGSPSQSIPFARHRVFSETYGRGIEQLTLLGLAEAGNDSARLTPQGVSFASNLMGAIMAGNTFDDRSETAFPLAHAIAASTLKNERTAISEEGLEYLYEVPHLRRIGIPA
jgi:hypothetical protein